MFATIEEAEKAAAMLRRFGIRALARPPDDRGFACVQVWPRLADDSNLGSWEEVVDLIERRVAR